MKTQEQMDQEAAEKYGGEQIPYDTVWPKFRMQNVPRVFLRDLAEASYAAGIAYGRANPAVSEDAGEQVQSEESAGEMLNRLGMDGKLWAEEFLKLKRGKIIGKDFDFGDALGWFANAIMAGHDRATNRERAKLQKVRDMIKPSIVVDHDCEECGNFTSVRYEIKELRETLALLDEEGE